MDAAAFLFGVVVGMIAAHAALCHEERIRGAVDVLVALCRTARYLWREITGGCDDGKKDDKR